ncbi:hypothetical protein CSKR_102044 [Clonorchis sinensis]|uniref:Uncharacterized protein n=1 Tax=Clonorchis sinensis TaxID=79923 RepID=A0A3R7C4V1_CLOSI|nr:hypothetical protein CSKR_102044 [Clonorchis sinensis]
MLQRDSTNSIRDLTFQETQSGCTRRRATHMPHHEDHSNYAGGKYGSAKEEGLRCGVIYLRTPTEQLQTIEQGSKTLICISFTKLNIPLLLERVFLNFLWMFIDCYSTASKCYKETPQIP